MMPVNTGKRLDTHAQITGRLPQTDATLHKPGRRCVPQRMRRHPASQLRQPDRAFERRLHRLHRLAVKFDKVCVGDALVAPPSQMSENPVRQWHRRLTPVGRTLSLRQPVEDAFVQLDIRGAIGPDGRRRRNRR